MAERLSHWTVVWKFVGSNLRCDTGVSHQNANDADFDTQLGISVARGGKCRGEVRHAMGIAKTLLGTKMWYY